MGRGLRRLIHSEKRILLNFYNYLNKNDTLRKKENKII